MRWPFLPLAEQLYRKRRGMLMLRDCIVGHIPRYMWKRIEGRKHLRPLLKVVLR